MNEGMVDLWNDTVTREDTVFYVGDFSLQPEMVERWLPRLHFKEIHLIMGNHDRPFKDKKGSWAHRYLDWGFTSVRHKAELKIDPLEGFLISHFPYRDPRDPDQRNQDRRLVDKGEWLLCGHVHEKWMCKGRMINVGVDVWQGRPVKLETLLEVRKLAEQPRVRRSIIAVPPIKPWRVS